MKKRFLALLLSCTVLAMQLTGCGNGIDDKGIDSSNVSQLTDSSQEESSSQEDSAVEAAVEEYSVFAEVNESYTAQTICSHAVNTDDYTLSFQDGTQKKVFDVIGNVSVNVIAQDKQGSIHNWIMKVVVGDSTPPVIQGVKDISVEQGQPVDLKKGITVKDNFDDNVELTAEYDPADNDHNAVGRHNITYKATDSSGNVALLTAVLEIKAVTTATTAATTKETQKTTQKTTVKTTTKSSQSQTKATASQPKVTVTTKAPAASSPNVNFYKNNLVVAGDSIAYGFCAYGYIPYSHNIAKGSMAMRNYKDTSLFMFNPTGTYLSCMNAISAVKPKLLYVSMGMNDINIINQQTYANYYVDFLRQVRARVPGCIIVACNITPTEARRTDFNSLRIQTFNAKMQAAVKAMNDPNIILFDAYSVVSAGGTYMASGYSAGDGIHLQGHVYQKLLNRLAVVLDQYGVKEKIQ